MRNLIAVCAIFASGLVLAGVAEADEVVLTPSKDNTLYESAAGALSNGAGAGVFAGRTGGAPGTSIRRALLAFDIAGAVPAGSTVNSVTLRMHVSQVGFGNPPSDVGIHPIVRDWGEGASVAGSGGGGGAPAEPGDATWLHTFFDTDFWDAPGGDFDPAASASILVDQVAFYEWLSTPEMVADAQSWLDDPAANFGWLLRGDESVSSTARRFDSREHLNPDVRPTLRIDFTPPAECDPCDANCDGVINSFDVEPFVAVLFGEQGCAPCTGDANGDGEVNSFDIDSFLDCLFP